jgi:ArsR family transcriptional regulator
VTFITLLSSYLIVLYIQEIEYLNGIITMISPFDLFTLEAELFNALAHPSRLEILELLRDGECCVCHIQAVLDQRQAYISQHLNVLRQAGLVVNRKDGKRVYYRVSDAQIFVLVDGVKAFLQIHSRQMVRFPAGPQSISPKKPCNCPQCSPTPAC